MSNYEHGFIAANDIVITGYGLSLTTIDTWLKNHQLSTNLAIAPEQITAFLNQHVANNQVEYAYIQRFDEGLLFIENPYPKKQTTSLASTDELDFQLSNAIDQLYHVPVDLHNRLIQFVDKYADHIAVADFYD